MISKFGLIVSILPLGLTPMVVIQVVNHLSSLWMNMITKPLLMFGLLILMDSIKIPVMLVIHLLNVTLFSKSTIGTHGTMLLMISTLMDLAIEELVILLVSSLIMEMLLGLIMKFLPL